MKKYLVLLILSFLVISCNKGGHTPDPGPDPVPVESGGSNISYQLLVYSFADSNGDGIGDFKGIEQKLDYFTSLGVEALWLSPIHPAASYHGYDVTDYASVNPEYGSEADFKALLDAAHSKGIRIYLDYVLNHSSKNHPWFLDATSSAESQYRDYYMISSDPEKDVKAGKFPMMSKSSYNSGEWTRVATGSTEAEKVKFTLTVSGGKPASIKMEKVDEISNAGSQNTGIWIYYSDGKMEEFYQSAGVYSLSLELSSDWGVLIRTSTSDTWPTGTKYGGKEGQNMLAYGTSVNLYPSSSSFDPADLLLPGMSQEYYLSVFGSYMPDINYGAAESCENSAAFRAVTEAADKWIGMGVDGFRLDAVKHIYHNSKSDENPIFLRKFYDHCNSTYKSSGGKGDFYMVGEHFSEPVEVTPYYAGIPAFFEFGFWWRLTEALNSANAQTFAATISSYHNSYTQKRPGAIAATKLSNHDEDRAGSSLGRNIAKMKLAAAVLLTSGGQPYIYQGEELGYWGTKSGGDEYVRTPIIWNADGSSMADAKLGGKVDKSMLTSAVSVQTQSASDDSLLALYRKLGLLRKGYKALGEGDMTPCTVSNSSVGAWYRTSGTQKLLVVHNFGGSPANVILNDDLSEVIFSNGSFKVSGVTLSLSSYSSVVFQL